MLPTLHRRGDTLPDFCLCRVQSRHHETYFKQCWRREYSYFLQHDHQGEKKSTSIYPPICSRMEDKLFQFYRNECFMSCLCFPASVLNSYILLNAWMFSTKNAPWALRFCGFQFRNTRRVNAVIFLPLGIWAIYLFFLINRKRNSLIILCLEKPAITICVYFLQFHFRCIKSSRCHLLPSAYSLFFLIV